MHLTSGRPPEGPPRAMQLKANLRIVTDRIQWQAHSDPAYSLGNFPQQVARNLDMLEPKVQIAICRAAALHLDAVDQGRILLRQFF